MGRRKYVLKEQLEKREKVNFESFGENKHKRSKTQGRKGKEKLVFVKGEKKILKRKGKRDNQEKDKEGRIRRAKNKSKGE